MFKNNFFKKVASCCLTLAGVLSLSMPCNAGWINDSCYINTKFEIFLEDNFRVLKHTKNNGINFCECKDCETNMYFVVFYMNSDILEKEYKEFKTANPKQFSKEDKEIKNFVDFLSKKFEVDIKNINRYTFIVNDENNKIENSDLYNLIYKNRYKNFDFIYEQDIFDGDDYKNAKLKKELFKKLYFDDNNFELGICAGTLGVLSLVTLGISGAFIATKNASDSKVSKKTNSISKKVMELAKSIIN